MTHLPVAGPFGEFDLAYEARLDPVCPVLVRNVRKRLLVCPQRHHARVQGREHLLGESPAAVADIDKLALVVDPKHERAKMLAAPARFGEAEDDGFLLMAGFYFEPF